jgi:cell division protease FtsH
MDNDKNQFGDNSRSPKQGKNIALILIIILIALSFVWIMNKDDRGNVNITYSKFLDWVSGWYRFKVGDVVREGKFVSYDEASKTYTFETAGIDGQSKRYQVKESDSKKIIHIRKVKIINKQITGNYENESGGANKFTSYMPSSDPSLLKLLREKNIVISGEPPSTNYFLQILTTIIPWILIFGVLWFIMFRQIQGSGNKAMSFGKSRAKLHKHSGKKITFADVAGIEEAKEEVKEIIDFLKDPTKFKKMGAKIPKGVLLIGPPGTGKTLLAKAIAGEANRPFFSMSGSEFVEMFVGVGASRVRDLFDQGKRHAPCILFIDELDAVGRVRGAGYGGGHDEREQTLNQMLVEMDGFDTDTTVIVIGATNRPDVLDPALLRPGRFDRQVIVNKPDLKGREEILKVHAEKIPLSKTVEVNTIARGTPGFSGADLANLVNEAALVAARKNKKKVDMEDFEFAKDKVIMGPERRSLIMNDKEKELTAYHEAGHALIGSIIENADPLHKVTIIPRGRALGVTMHLPLEDRYTYDKAYCLANMMMLLGGRLAEEIKFGDGGLTNGASNDIGKVTHLARAMVCEWGMSKKLGPITYGQKEEPIFIGKEIARHKDYSEVTAKEIDDELKVVVDYCYDKAKKIMKDNVDKLELIARALLEKESLDQEEVKQLLGDIPKVKVL